MRSVILNIGTTDVYKSRSAFLKHPVPKGQPFETPMNAKKEAEAGSRLAERPEGLGLDAGGAPHAQARAGRGRKAPFCLAKLARIEASKLADSGGVAPCIYT